MVEKDAVRRSYDELADVYAARRPENDRGTGILETFLGSCSARSEPIRVLDAGCGQGTPVLSRVSDGARAVGLDFSRGQLRLAADAAPDAALVQGDMTALPFATGAFDAAVAYWSIIHIPMDDHQSVIDEFARVLRPDGRLLLCEGTNEWAGENPDWLDSGVEMQWNIAGADATREQLRSAGFTIVDRWGAPETLAADEDEADSDVDDDLPWTFFSARLDA
ncbi:class I SAM-dependent methyltransferase [Halosolutus gelatinilyticus]|uniref:class I SAM-dependent methyltransferase n=1 Tax=Halosolutus gelatinilyticus TaxID=2931975 RepID=UPI001FF5BC2A|nr:class I SAM-dependent methyltransferase [Halosolutus gelatinilyticus]